MNIFELEKAGEIEALRFKNKRRNLKVLKQIRRTHIKKDAKRKALAPGKRVSKTGKIYWETRKNRSDEVGKTI